jgi:hypothetical protein
MQHARDEGELTMTVNVYGEAPCRSSNKTRYTRQSTGARGVGIVVLAGQ